MICPKCSSVLPEGQLFCGNCGSRTSPDNFNSLSERLASIESQFAATSSTSKRTEQKYLELETATNIVDRVTKWTTLFLYWVGIPTAAILILLALIVGRGEIDLRQSVVDAKKHVDDVVSQQKKEVGDMVADTKRLSAAALDTAKQVNADVVKTKQGVDGLEKQVEARSADLQRLDATIKASTVKVTALEQTVQAGSAQVAQLQQRLRNVETEKTAAALTNSMLGLFGTYDVMGADGRVSSESKAHDDLYIAYSLVDNLKTRELLNASPVKVVESMRSLSDHGYKVFRGPVSLVTSSGTGYRNTGSAFSAYDCNSEWSGLKLQPPCVLYFDESMKSKALEIRKLVGVVQDIPEDKVRYVSPAKLAKAMQDLLRMSGVDFVLVIGKQAD